MGAVDLFQFSYFYPDNYCCTFFFYHGSTCVCFLGQFYM